MKRFLFGGIVFVLVLSVLPVGTLSAQDDSCDPAAVESWIQNRQTWRQVSQETLDAQGVSVGSAMAQLADHLQAIEDLPRPACADETMLWTYYLYANWQHFLICAQIGDSDCLAEMQVRLADYRQRDEQVMATLEANLELFTPTLQPPAKSSNTSPTLESDLVDPAEGVSPDFRSVEVQYDETTIMITVTLYSGLESDDEHFFVYLYGAYADMLRIYGTQFDLQRDNDNNGHFEETLDTGTIELGSDTLQFQFSLELMPDIAQKRVWAYSMMSGDRMPDKGKGDLTPVFGTISPLLPDED